MQMLPWENLPALRNQEIYRMPSMRSIFLALTRSTNHHKDASAMAPPFPVIDPFDAFYLLNPSGDLISTQDEFYQLFRNYEWKVTMMCLLLFKQPFFSLCILQKKNSPTCVV
jgi:separase